MATTNISMITVRIYCLNLIIRTGCTQKSEDVGSLMSAFFFGAKSPPVSR